MIININNNMAGTIINEKINGIFICDDSTIEKLIEKGEEWTQDDFLKSMKLDKFNHIINFEKEENIDRLIKSLNKLKERLKEI